MPQWQKRHDSLSVQGHAPEHADGRACGDRWWTLYALVYAGQTDEHGGPGRRPAVDGPRADAGVRDGVRLDSDHAGAARLRVALSTAAREAAAAVAAVRAVHGGGGGVSRALSAVVLNPVVGWFRVLPPLSALLLIKALNSTLLLWLMIGVAHAWWYARQAAERERQAEQLQARLVEARLEALSAQLDPHFLFNSLNAIAEMVHRDAAAADRMLVGLGESPAREPRPPAFAVGAAG